MSSDKAGTRMRFATLANTKFHRIIIVFVRDKLMRHSNTLYLYSMPPCHMDGRGCTQRYAAFGFAVAIALLAYVASKNKPANITITHNFTVSSLFASIWSA